ncbi:MAG: cell division protein ZapA [Sphingomonadales bacterium]|nr:cell division protein ZapA [Sphingomonadales bacterium]
MAQINITINNQNYSLACRDGEEERLTALAQYVSSKVDHLVGSLGQVGDTRLLLMSALLIADEMHEIKDGGGASAGGDDMRKKTAGVLDEASIAIENIAETLETH